MPRLRSLCLLTLFALLSSTMLFAQRDLGTITGTVSDPQGAAVPNATVVITEDATGLTYQVQTDSAGTYVRPLLKAGTYTVDVEATGFQKSVQKGIIVSPGGSKRRKRHFAGRQRIADGGGFRCRAAAGD